MKPIIVTLLYLASGDIKQDRFEIFESCSSFYYGNVAIEDNKKKRLFHNQYYYKYKNKKVIGYVCAGKEPR